ncbi:hypothetical protein UFOVP233_81 [uncultured Caudovirales phage]|uniref:Uncharacterized protein n=1 Tax=uncultured Caudovirales phage TaxID=2100421 RepID=A0A6J7WUE1_9CAUD|nr:hypothetical protein UFOVP233_81 [uncultured Caudovirales phage]
MLTLNTQKKSTRKLPLRVWLMLLLLTLMPGCAATGRSATETAMCNEMRADLPSYSRHDTDQTKAEGLRFLATFHAICG